MQVAATQFAKHLQSQAGLRSLYTFHGDEALLQQEALDAFMKETQRHVTGDVRLRFEAPGVGRVVGRRSPAALYDHGLATYDAADTFRHADSEGFVRIFGLGVKTWATRQGAKNATPRS